MYRKREKLEFWAIRLLNLKILLCLTVWTITFRLIFIRLFGLETCASCVIVCVTIQPLAAIQMNHLSDWEKISTMLFIHLTTPMCAVAKWYGATTCDLNVAGSNPTRGAPTPTQRAIPSGSVNEYQRKLGSKRAYHAMH